ncbi:HAMP domain-containing histidine kinase [Novosphingobium sp. MW5]|nr:HAMP domain-containing histidine kinase [Novosphingobium sp. MW5]
MEGLGRSLFRSTIARFVALLFLSQVALTFGVLFFVRQSSEATLRSEQQELVRGLRNDLVAAYREGGERQLVRLVGVRLQATESEVPIILLVRRDGTVLAGNLKAWPAVVPKETSWTSATLLRNNSGRAELTGVITTRLGNDGYLLTGHVIDASVRLKNLNREAMLGALLLAIPLALLLALLLGRMINLRVRHIAETAEAVGSGDFSHRVLSDGSGDSFDALGQGVNAMLDRIEMLVGELRIVTDGLAHDLRSPITRLKFTLERAMIETSDPVALSALEKVSAEAETLLAMLSTALQITRAEAGIGRERFVETDISALLADLVEIYGPIAEEQSFILSSKASAGLVVPVHRELLSQALGNLVENALKYASEGREIVLSASTSPHGVELSVADNGVGIPADRRAEAMRKFGRLDPARHVAGSGLGLALVEAVARLHGGRLELGDNAPGLVATMSIQPNAGIVKPAE